MVKRRGPGPIGSLYLTLYNLVQTAAWSFILAKSLVFIVGRGCYKGVFDHVFWELGIAQTAGYLEVVHCLIGLVPSNPFLTLVQISSRVVVFWGTLVAVPETRDQLGLPMLLVAWCIAEITRYSYYVLSQHNICPKFMTWSRYSFFIILYPVGVAGELISLYKSIPYIRERQLFTYALPNAWNISFDYATVTLLIMLTYFPAFPQLYGHMLKQRSKILNPPKDTPGKKAQ